VDFKSKVEARDNFTLIEDAEMQDKVVEHTTAEALSVRIYIFSFLEETCEILFKKRTNNVKKKIN